MSDTDSDNGFPVPNFLSMFSDQSTERLEAMVDQWEKWEAKGADQAEKAVEETTHLMRATMDYTLELNSELRKQAIENTRKTLEMMGGSSDD